MVWEVLLLLALTRAEDCSKLCTNVNNICQILNQVKVCDSSLVIAIGYRITVTNSTLYCVQVENIGEPNCTISLASESIIISGSTLMASLISISAKDLEISADSALNANGTGYHLGPGNAGDANGPSYGGRGGGTCGELTKYLTYGDQYDPRTFYGSGGHTKYSNGGGQVIIAAENFTLRGNITACGNLPLNNIHLGTPAGLGATSAGGTGGTIYINVTIFADLDKGLILANGGNGGEEGYGGGGGRVAIYGPVDKVRVKARGGTGGHKRCPIGGAGTIFLAKDDLLIVDNSMQPGRNPTPVTTRPTLSLRIENSALVTPAFSHQSMNLKSLTISGSRLEVSQVAGSGDSFDSTLILLVSDIVTLANQGTIGSTEGESVSITTKKLLSDSSSGIYFGASLNITADNVNMKGDLEGNSIVTDKSQIIINVKENFSLLLDGSLKARKIAIAANSVVIEGYVVAAEKTCVEELNYFARNPPFHYITGPPGQERAAANYSVPQLLSSNFTCLIIARKNLTMDDNSKVIGARVGIFGVSAIIKGLISSSGLGCSSNTGPGRGESVERMCSGSGAGYGGLGGSGKGSSSATQAACKASISQGKAYSDEQNPWFEGSGGGSAAGVGGPGGGFIDVEMLNDIYLSGFIGADGGDAPRHPSDLILGSGGGSGGGIFISTKHIAGLGARIKANGGRGSVIGGGGSGGRIVFAWFGEVTNGAAHNTANFSTYWSKQDVVVLGGDPGRPTETSDGQGERGSRVARSCAPGSYEFNCKLCDIGQFTIGTQFQATCQRCSNGPPTAIYTQKGVATTECPYNCPADYSPSVVNPQCKSPFEEFFDVFGGLAGALVFIVVIIVLIAVLPLGGHMLYQRYSNRSVLQQSLLTPNEHIERKMPAKKAENPVLNKEDLPFHERRIFLLGENSYYKPWSLPKAPPLEIEDAVVLEDYSAFATSINNLTRWFPWQHTLCLILLWAHHPFGLYVLNVLRKQKYWNVREYIKSYNETIWRKIQDRQLSNSLRFSCSDDFTLAYLDITSFGKTIAQWDERPNLPLTMLCAGDGSFWNPYHLDTKDLMIQLLAWSMESEAVEEYQVFLHMFNMYLKTVVLDAPVPNKKQSEIVALQQLVAKYNSELFHGNDYHVTLALFQAPMVIEKGKYVQVQWSGELNSKVIASYALDPINVSNSFLYSFKVGLIFTKYFRSPDSRDHSLDIDPRARSMLYFEPNSISAAQDVSLFPTTLHFVEDPSDSAPFSECSLRALLLVPAGWNQYAVMVGLLLSIFIDIVRNSQSIALVVLTDSTLEQNLLKYVIFILVLPFANVVTPFLSLVLPTQLMLVLPRLISWYISFQLVACLSAFPNFAFFILQRPSWFRVMLLVVQLAAKVCSLRLAAMHKANIEAISFFEVRNM